MHSRLKGPTPSPACSSSWFRKTDNNSAPLKPELIHAGEGGRIFHFEHMPGGEIRHGTVFRETEAVTRNDPRRQLKTDELQIVLAQKGIDLRNGQMMFLDMEQEVATFTDAEIIGVIGDRFHGRAQELLTAATN